jgi:hypothetical protein
MSPTFVIFPSDISRDPQAILLLPLSIFPNPEVILPASKAPTVVILEVPGHVDKAVFSTFPSPTSDEVVFELSKV